MNKYFDQNALSIISSSTLNEDREKDASLNCSFVEIVLKKSTQCRSLIADDYWSNNIDLVYKLKKQTMEPSSKNPAEKSELKDVDKFRQILQSQYDYKMNNEAVLDDYAAMLACRFGDTVLTEECSMFASSFSSTGIGYTFNTLPFLNMFKNTSSNFAYY